MQKNPPSLCDFSERLKNHRLFWPPNDCFWVNHQSHNSLDPGYSRMIFLVWEYGTPYGPMVYHHKKPHFEAWMRPPFSDPKQILSLSLRSKWNRLTLSFTSAWTEDIGKVCVWGRNIVQRSLPKGSKHWEWGRPVPRKPSRQCKQPGWSTKNWM